MTTPKRAAAIAAVVLGATVVGGIPAAQAASAAPPAPQAAAAMYPDVPCTPERDGEFRYDDNGVLWGCQYVEGQWIWVPAAY